MSVEEMTLKADLLTDKSLESTRQILNMAEESLNIGNETMTMLDEQGEQLRNIKREMDHISQNIKQAQENLNELSSCCCLWPFYRPRSTKRDQSYKQVRLPNQRKQKRTSSHPTVVHKELENSARSATPSGPYINRVTNDKREDEMEENLQQVVSIIKTLKHVALGMSNELDNQNKDIKDIEEKVVKGTDEVSTAEKQARELLT